PEMGVFLGEQVSDAQHGKPSLRARSTHAVRESNPHIPTGAARGHLVLRAREIACHVAYGPRPAGIVVAPEIERFPSEGPPARHFPNLVREGEDQLADAVDPRDHDLVSVELDCDVDLAPVAFVEV